MLLPGVAGVACVALGRRRIGAMLPVSRYVVEGRSMEPAYCPGERLIVDRVAYRRGVRPAIGDVVVARDPEREGRYLLKRVAAPPGETTGEGVYVLGDNAGESRDSRVFGPLPPDAIVGRAWFRY